MRLDHHRDNLEHARLVRNPKVYVLNKDSPLGFAEVHNMRKPVTLCSRLVISIQLS